MALMPVQKFPLKAAKSSTLSTESSWLVEDIVGGPKIQTVNGKKKKFYKVRWSESYEQEGNIPAVLIQEYESKGKRTIKILGPVVEPNENEKVASDANSIDDENADPLPFKLQRAKFAVEINGEISIISYKQLRANYKEELLVYYEERAQISK